jgi:hypothetical protein
LAEDYTMNRVIDRFRMRFEHAPEATLRALSLACAVFAIVLALAAFAYGKLHRFDHWVPEVIEYENVKVAAALSEVAYGFRRGYVAHTQVYDALRRGGMAYFPEFLEPLGKKFPANLSDVELLNRALKDAAQLGKLRPAARIMADLKPVEPIDLGMVDFYSYAFRLFGIEIQSFFKFYYVLYFASIGLFVLAYWRQPGPMAAMLVIVAAHFFAQAFLVGGVSAAQIFGVATPYNYRFVTVLGILSAFHLALAVLRPPRASVVSVLALIGQAALLFFVSTMRRSALWEVLWVATIAGALVGLILLWRLNALKRWPQLDSAPLLVRRALSWPAIAFVMVFVVLGAAHNAKTDAAYRFSDEWLPYHMVWHSLFVGLSLHPHWVRRFGQEYSDEKGEPQLGDALAIKAAEVWLERRYGIGKSYIVSPIYGYKYRTLERVLHDAFFDFARKNPRFILELQLIHKPLTLVKNYVIWNVRTARAMPLWGLGLLLAALALAGAVCAALGWIHSPQTLELARLLTLGAAWAVLPAVVVFPSYSTMADQALILDAALLAWAGVALARWTASYRARMAGAAVPSS